jgi:hypothetical protein
MPDLDQPNHQPIYTSRGILYTPDMRQAGTVISEDRRLLLNKAFQERAEEIDKLYKRPFIPTLH